MKLVLLVLACAVAAEFQPPWKGRTARSPSGAHSIRVKRAGKLCAFELAGPDALFKGTTETFPVGIHVLDTRVAAVFFDHYGLEGRRTVVALIHPKTGWAIDYRRLFGEDPPNDGGWSRTWWVDEPRGRVVVIHADGRARDIALRDGSVTAAGPAAIFAAFDVPNARIRALEAAAALQPKGLAAAVAPLARDESLRANVRVRAAIALQRAGGDEVPLELFAAALETAKGRSARYLCDQAAALHGARAIDVLSDAALLEDTAMPAVRALVSLAPKSGPALADLVAHGDLDSSARAAAASALGKLPAHFAVDGLARRMKNTDPEVAGALLRAALATGAKGLHRKLQSRETELLGVLDRRTASVGWLADHFRMLPTTEAVKPLLGALSKHRRDPALAARIIAALKTCTGQDFGDNPNTWLKKNLVR